MRRRKYPHVGRRRCLFFLLSYFASGSVGDVIVAGIVVVVAVAVFPTSPAVVPYGIDSRLIGFLPTKSVLADQETIDGTMGFGARRQQPQRLMTLDGPVHQRRKY